MQHGHIQIKFNFGLGPTQGIGPRPSDLNLVVNVLSIYYSSACMQNFSIKYLQLPVLRQWQCNLTNRYCEMVPDVRSTPTIYPSDLSKTIIIKFYHFVTKRATCLDGAVDSVSQLANRSVPI